MRDIDRRLLRPAVGLVLGLAMPLGCSTSQRVHTETAVAKILVSDQEEAQIGQQVQAQLASQHVKFIEDPAVIAYVQGIGKRLFPQAEHDRPNVKWDLHVIDDPKTVNAFAVPGGHLYVYSGLIQMADNEAELAGVLAHEIGHVVARHAARNMVDAYGLEAVLGLALGQNPSLLKQLAAKVVGTGALLAHSRADEQEADEYGARYSSAAGYDPKGLVTFFSKLQKKEGHAPAALTWLSDHPATPDRIAHVTQFVQEHHLGGGDLGADRLAPIKQRLSGSPMAAQP